MLFGLRVYQSFFSALMPSACKFYPSCSRYAAEAVRVHGARRGSWLALRRLLRCHPFSRGGVDLVPDPADLAHVEDCVLSDVRVPSNSRDDESVVFSSTGFSLWGLNFAARSQTENPNVLLDRNDKAPCDSETSKAPPTEVRS